MPLKIAIYDTVHLDLIIPYAQLLAEEEFTVCFITSADFKDELESILARKNSRYTWYFLNPNDSIRTFSISIFLIFKSRQYDLVILNSIDSRHLIIYTILKLFRPRKILLNLHDINNFFKTKWSVSIRTNIRSAGKKLLMLLTDGYIVNMEAMKNYIAANHFTKKQVYWLQPVFYTPPAQATKTTFSNTIVVPGSIEQKRRNYDLVLYAAQEMLNDKIPVTWILAGKPVEKYGAAIIKKAKKLNTRGAVISYFQEEIPENEFQHILATCSFIFSPLVSPTKVRDNIMEVYGQSKASGNVNDTIRHAKPFIVPSTFTVPADIASSCIIYNSKEDLVEQLLKLLTDNQTLADFKKKAEENAGKFTKERIINMFKAAL